MEEAQTTARTEELVRRAIEYLRRRIRVDQAVLFGSHARGDADRWSDIDLAVFSSDFARMGDICFKETNPDPHRQGRHLRPRPGPARLEPFDSGHEARETDPRTGEA